MKKTTNPLGLSALAACAIAILSLPASGTTLIDLGKSISDNGITPTGIYWNFDGNALDGSPSGYNGSLVGGKPGQGPTYVEGVFGQAIRLQGTNDTNQRDPSVYWSGTGAADNARMDFVGQSFTGGAWVSFDSIRTGSTQYVHLLERGQYSPSGYSQNFFSLALEKDVNDQWKIVFNIANPSLGVHRPASTVVTTAFNDLDWHHVGFTFEYVPSGNNLITFYLDGVQLGAVRTESFDLVATSLERDRKFTVGERGTSLWTSDFNGAVDDVFITSGLYTFYTIPEPGTVVLGGGMLMVLMGARVFSGKRG